jgi:hypothetical protein
VSPLVVPLSGTAAASANLALNKPATASGSQAGYPPTNMTDGNTGSYWESTNHAFPQWAQVDLGSLAPISKVVLTLPPPSAWTKRTQTLSVLGSADGTTFTQILPSTGYAFDPASDNTVTITFPSVMARYVRLDFTANDGWPAAQVSEFEVFQ